MKVLFPGWAAFGMFLAVLLTAYAPVLMTTYAFSDDYGSLAKDKEAVGYITEGRPLLALSKYFFFRVATAIEHLVWLRFVGIVGLAGVAWSVFHLLVRTGWGRVQSFCVAVVMCTSLPFQVYEAWAGSSLDSFAALVSVYAFFLGERAFKTAQRRLKWRLTAGASLALLAGLTIHQAAAMFFWVLVAVVVLKPETPLDEAVHRFGWYGLIAAVGLLGGLGVVELGLALNPDVPARSGLAQDIPLKVVWFLFEALPNALHFALLSPSWLFSGDGPTLSSFQRGVDILLAWGALDVIAGGLALYFQGTRPARLGKVGLAGAILLLSYAPNLVIAENWATYRTLSGLSSIVVLYALFACHGYAHYLRWPFAPGWAHAVMGSVALASVLSAMYHVQTYFVAPQVRELALMRSQLAREELSQARGIYVIRPAWWETLAPLVRYDEFGRPSSLVRPWTVRHMVVVLLRAMAPDHAALPVTAVFADDPIDPPPDSLVIDMRNLRLQAQRNDRDL